ncbi:MAG: chemotaxis protein CheW [Desulfobacterales bacterium]
MEWLTFFVGEAHMALEARYVYQVIDDAQITPVPLSSECCLGLIYYRGELFDVLHLAPLLQQTENRAPETDRIILLKWSGRKLALVPDRMGELLWLEEDCGEPIDSRTGPKIRLITPKKIWQRLLEQPHGFRKV